MMYEQAEKADRREGVLLAAFEELDATVGKTAALADQVAAQLQPILTPAPTEAAPLEDTQADHASPLTGRVRNTVRHLREIQAKLAALSANIDL
jgi:hypothetical protein